MSCSIVLGGCCAPEGKGAAEARALLQGLPPDAGPQAAKAELTRSGFEINDVVRHGDRPIASTSPLIWREVVARKMGPSCHPLIGHGTVVKLYFDGHGTLVDSNVYEMDEGP